MADKFWMVFRKDGGLPPSKVHETKDDAIEEASRLVRKTGGEFFVMEAVGVVAPIEPRVAYCDLP